MAWVVRFLVVHLLGPRVLRRVAARWGADPTSRGGRLVGTVAATAGGVDRLHRLALIGLGVSLAILALGCVGVAALVVWAVR